MSAALTVIFVRRLLLVLGDIAAYGFEQHVDVAGRVEDGQESSDIDSVGAEVMKHGAPVVEQGFDIDKLDRLFAVPDDPLAEVKAFGAFQIEPAGAFEIIAVSGSEDAGHLRRGG
jgi:hypothetical protein